MKSQCEIDGEEWRDAVGYEGLYEVSNLGRVRRSSPAPGTRKGYILSSPLNSDGYPSLNLYKDGKRISAKVHILVARAFIGNPPDNLSEVNHCNGDKSNCRWDNLEYTDRSGNVKHAFRVLGRKPVRNFGESSGNAKIKEDDVRRIRKLAADGMTQESIAAQYPIDRRQIGRIVNRLRWSHIE